MSKWSCAKKREALKLNQVGSDMQLSYGEIEIGVCLQAFYRASLA
jgi:hypothetical protein